MRVSYDTTKSVTSFPTDGSGNTMTQSGTGMCGVLLIVVVVFTTFFGSYAPPFESYALPLETMLYNSNSSGIYPN